MVTTKLVWYSDPHFIIEIRICSVFQCQCRVKSNLKLELRSKTKHLTIKHVSAIQIQNRGPFHKI